MIISPSLHGLTGRSIYLSAADNPALAEAIDKVAPEAAAAHKALRVLIDGAAKIAAAPVLEDLAGALTAELSAGKAFPKDVLARVAATAAAGNTWNPRCTDPAGDRWPARRGQGAGSHREGRCAAHPPAHPPDRDPGDHRPGSGARRSRRCDQAAADRRLADHPRRGDPVRADPPGAAAPVQADMGRDVQARRRRRDNAGPRGGLGQVVDLAPRRTPRRPVRPATASHPALARRRDQRGCRCVADPTPRGGPVGADEGRVPSPSERRQRGAVRPADPPRHVGQRRPVAVQMARPAHRQDRRARRSVTNHTRPAARPEPTRDGPNNQGHGGGGVHPLPPGRQAAHRVLLLGVSAMHP